jgi:alanyl aminopeptidase
VRVALVALILAACSAPPARVRPLPVEKPAPFRVDRPSPPLTEHRLPTTFVPHAYDAHVKIQPESIEATIEIRAKLITPSDSILLDARGLTITRARARGDGWTVPLEARTIQNHELAAQKLVLLSARPLPAGAITIEIDYRAAIDNLGIVDDRQMSYSSVRGLFRQRFEGHSYLFTMFEPFSARTVFPCVDEPSSRARWKLTLDVPATEVVASNGRIVKETTLDATTKRVEFAPTSPLPSYLVAFAVGPFDIVHGTTSANGTPIRLLAQRGRGAAARHAANSIAPILDALDAWTSRPYAFGKLDVVSVPMTGNRWFAMEHPGLVTIGETGVRKAQPGADHEWIHTMSHELAHQWFGNLVSPAWWNEIWLGESFTVWLAETIARQLRPQADDTLQAARDTLGVLDRDRNRWGQTLAPTIRAPLARSFTFDDLGPYFSGDRGAVYLASLEAFVGPQAFHDMMRSYLATNAHRSVDTRAFAKALSGVTYPLLSRMSSLDVGLDHALDTPSAPRVWLELACSPTKNVAHLSVTRGWKVPMCVAFGTTSRTEQCVIVDDTAEIDLGPTCPTWFSPNATGAGFYRTIWVPGLVDGLARHGWPHLAPQERARFLVELEEGSLATNGAAIADASTSLGAVIALASSGANDPLARRWIASTIAAHYPKVPDDLRANLVKKLEPLLAQVRAFDVSLAVGSDELAARAAELELAATLGDPVLVARGPALYAALSKADPVYWPWIRLLAARGEPSLIPELLASSVHDNASTLARVPDIARLVAASLYPPSTTLRLFHRACSAPERADAISAAKLANDRDLVEPIDRCIAGRAKLEPTFRAWLGSARGVRRLR